MAEDIVRERLLENIRALQPKYTEAVKALKNWPDPHSDLYETWNKLDAYQPGDNPDKAVYVVAMCHTALKPFAQNYSTIRNYREAQRKLEEYDQKG